MHILEQALRERRLGAATSRTAKEEMSREKVDLGAGQHYPRGGFASSGTN